MALATEPAIIRPTSRSITQVAERAPQLSALTGLRFFAAILVVSVHFGLACLPAPVHALAQSGAVGVSLFFVLSGFILTYSYQNLGGGVRGGRRAFYIARFARIYPVYTAGLLIAAGPALWAPPSWPLHASAWLVAASSLTLTQAWLPGIHFYLNGPGWSLSAEAFFYALFPFLLPVLLRLRTHFLVPCGLLCYTAALVAPTAYFYLRPDSIYVQPAPFWIDVVLFNPLLHLPEFLSGMVIGVLFVRVRSTRASLPFAGPCLTGTAALTLLVIAEGNRVPQYFTRTGTLIPAFGLLIFLTAWRQGWVAIVLSHPLTVRCGEASYALYILHYPLHAWMAHLLGVADQATLASLPFFVVYVGVSVSLSLLVCSVIETPARRAICRAFR